MAIPRVLARMKARALRAMNQSCYVLSESGAALNSAGGRSAAKTTWNPVLSQAWSSTTTYAFNAPANGVDGKLYHSLIANNLDREPSASPTYWALGFPCLKILLATLENAELLVILIEQLNDLWASATPPNTQWAT